jgi:hypothetical protein
MLTDDIEKILEEAKKRIVDNIQSSGITASGRTERSIRVEKYQGGVRLVVGGEQTAPFGTLEAGRKPAPPPQNFLQIIMQWIIDKKIEVKPIPYKKEGGGKYTPEQRGLISLAGAIIWSPNSGIVPTGTKRYKTPQNNIYSNVVKEVVPDVRKTIVKGIIDIIKTR